MILHEFHELLSGTLHTVSSPIQGPVVTTGYRLEEDVREHILIVGHDPSALSEVR